MNRTEAEFVIYMINEVANRNNLYPSKVYKEMERTGCISNYLVPFYDVLHTMSSESVTNDIMKYIRTRGAAI